jgi:hypothetical protein
MSKSTKIAKCNICGEEKMIVFEIYSKSPQYERFFCEECYEHRKEKVKCGHCEQLIAREDRADHDRDYHSQL